MSSEYERLSVALADAMFGSEYAGRPVYALPDAPTLQKALGDACVDGDCEEALGRVVRTTLHIDETGVTPFRWHALAARNHQREPLEVPPALPLLVLLSLAAEQMHADGDVAANNYYSRLHKLLKVPSFSCQRVETDYRRVANLLWGSLNSWLEAWEGERGVPTAYAVGGHAYIGLPMSQAVVRQHDREGLHELFALEGLAPGLRISPADMSATMDPYATTTPSPLSSHISRLWRVPAARERIVDAACLELETWDGSGLEEATSGQPINATRLLAFLRTFPRPSIEFNLMLPFRSNGPDTVRFELPAGEARVPTVPGPGGITRLSGVGGVSAASLINDKLSGDFGTQGHRAFGRMPKRVTPLRWEDLQGAYVEVERISLGEDSIVLARADTRLRVEHHLITHARPGWSELTGVPGIPEGWLVYQHVQLVSAPSGPIHLDLLPLAPRARTSLVLRGGFVMPGLLRKWSVLAPPEAVAVAAGAAKIEIRIYLGTRVDPTEVLVNDAWAGELAVLALADRGLTDGEYVVAMFVDDASKPAATALLRLRSADTPQFRVEETDIHLVYSPEESPLWPLSAGPAEWPAYVNGARIQGLPAEGVATPPPSVMREFSPRQRATEAPSAAPLRVGITVAQDSCLVTGMHRFVLPPVLPGQPPRRSVEGECETCGMVRRFAGTPWAAMKRNKDTTTAAPRVNIPPVLESDEPDFEVAFDALNHVGRGTPGTFERIAAQVEGSGLFADAFLRRLEVVGHLDVARGSHLQVTEWAMNTPALVPVAPGQWVLVGSRSKHLLAELSERLEPGQIRTSVDAGLARVEITGTLPTDGFADLGIHVVDDSTAAVVASALPHLSTVASSLKRVAVPAFRSAEFWDTTSASWRPTTTLTPIGAYRLKDFNSTYAVRSAHDIEDGTIGVGNAQIVKHIANLWANDPLVGYHSRSESVVTPLGADLPALYGRALSICSGRAPRELVDRRMLQYPGVPRSVANIVFDRISQ